MGLVISDVNKVWNIFQLWPYLGKENLTSQVKLMATTLLDCSPVCAFSQCIFWVYINPGLHFDSKVIFPFFFKRLLYFFLAKYWSHAKNNPAQQF